MLKDLARLLLSRKARNAARERRNRRKAAKIKLLMTLVVRNEEEILEQNIRFHAAMGVNGFIVTTHRSTDKTLVILEQLKKEGLVLEIIERTSPDHKHALWVNEMVKLAVKKYHATWIINADADEFYYSNSLDLKRSITQVPKANVLWVNSTISFPDDREDFLTGPYFIKRPFLDFEARQLGIEQDSKFHLFIGLPGCPKVIHATKGFHRVSNGNHDVSLRRRVKIQSADILCFHYHIRNFKGYEAKVLRWMEAASYMPDGMGDHMKRMISLYKKGKLQEDYETYFGKEMREFLIEHGIVTRDLSVPRFMQHMGIKTRPASSSKTD